MIDIGDGDPGFTQAVANRLDRESGRVFYAVEALLFDGGHQLSVANQRRRGVAGDPEVLAIHGRELPMVDSGKPLVLAGDPTNRELVTFQPGAEVEVLAAVDVVFPVLHGAFGEDGTIQGLLELADTPYVGAGVLASAAAMDKEFAKKLLAAEGLSVGRYVSLRRGQSTLDDADRERLGLPVFVKPSRAGKRS